MNKLSTAYFTASAVEADFKNFDPETNLIKGATEEKDRGIVAGYMSVFNNVDQGGDIVRPGAFKKSLSERKVKVLFNHNPNLVIGKMSGAYEDTYGLYAELSLNLRTDLGRETYELVKSGDLDGFSIGYRTIKSENVRHEGGSVGRELKELALFECSIVTFPMNQLALVTQVKNEFESLAEDATEPHLEAVKAASDVEGMIAALTAFKAERERPMREFIEGMKAIKAEKDAKMESFLNALRSLKS